MSASEPPSARRDSAGPVFVPGIDLARAFFLEVVQPLLDSRTPGVHYAAALIGPGSDVLCFDTPLSMDREWGPRLRLFLPEPELGERGPLFDRLLRSELPLEFLGYPTSYTAPDAQGMRRPQPRTHPPVEHLVEITSVGRFAQRLLGFDPSRSVSPRQWLLAPQERLLELTAGEVFVDSVGELSGLRERLSYYPRQVWIYLMAAQWRRLERREQLIGRAGLSGDDFGSRLLVAGLVRELVRLAFLIERRYAPWDQWLARSFAGLRCASRLGPPLQRALTAYDWIQRDLRLADAYTLLAAMHNNLGLTAPLPTEAGRSERGFATIDAGRFAAALVELVDDEALKPLVPMLAGGVDQLLASDEALLDPSFLTSLASVLEAGDAEAKRDASV